ncbi:MULTISPECIES: hypothetical protein [Rhizobiaceae]|jgi:hypothetical protein|uniref:Uncharacterized protein n=1 Tax=Aliirhizobium cellulosilyticum TaxID=393664 RepID=A0A7W4SRY6_9HYPH|nr:MULTISPECIES: hypothetical protein [Rhizobium/Agrobacterium group]MBB4347399.1 hypothetical protein [Rhizobium cellulosilyticum]MBB4410207.1 hypothetical protein [Rhizobium cellulosilyticum]MBB4444894.1 hypothetical protein [Rhizobium cellulosilyticum]MBO0142048.1 hypothetical protein [Agrobacterium sp. Ap1]
MNRNILALAGAVLLAASISSSSWADERPLIWQPIKNSDTSYAVKLGLRLPVRLETEAGFNVGVDSSKTGEVVNTPLKFWSRIKTEDRKRPAYQMSRDIGINMDGNAGSAAISMNYYEKQIATPTFNLERQSSYVVRYDGVQKDWAGLDASQSIKLRQRESGTAFVAVANGSANFSAVAASFGIEQPLGENITLSGSVNRNFTDATTVSSVNASYSYKW